MKNVLLAAGLCAGLADRGIYRWTRNPQYATVIPAYAAGWHWPAIRVRPSG